MFQIKRIDRSLRAADEPLGSKPKFWFYESDKQFLFKADERGTGEDWAEKTTCQLCELLGLPHVHYELAAEYEGDKFQRRIKSLDIEEVVSAPRSPWQNPYVERWVGSIRRECLNHVIVINEGHLKRILTKYFEYYHRSRTHLSLDRNAPVPREIEPPELGPVRAISYVGGLHHRYARRAV